MKQSTKVLLIVGIIALLVYPLIFVSGEFGGADGQAEELITQIDTSYQPWFSPLIEPASGEIESLLFALQAAVGSAVLFYYLGYSQGRKVERTQTSQTGGQERLGQVDSVNNHVHH